jgi:phosphoadenosine phosphosulfate reductase
MEIKLATPPYEDSEFPFAETDYTDISKPELSLEEVNELLRGMTPEQRLEWGFKTFGSGLAASTSAGIDSDMTVNLVANFNKSIPIIFMNTGFLFPETLEHKEKLEEKYGIRINEFGPSQEEINEVTRLQLWKPKTEVETGNPQLYSEITKLRPTTEAIEKLGIKALITGVRSDQTANRATLDFISIGKDDEYRINIFLDWPKDKVARYFDSNDLLRHPKYFEGFESVGDAHSTKPGKDRDGRDDEECGFNVVNGVVIRKSQWFNP